MYLIIDFCFVLLRAKQAPFFLRKANFRAFSHTSFSFRLEFFPSNPSAALAAGGGAASASNPDLFLCSVYDKLRTYFKNAKD